MSITNETFASVDKALSDLFVGSDPVLDAALASSAEAGLPAIAVSANLGKLLCLLVEMASARRVLEIGTLGGYSTIWLARGLPSEGKILSLELEEAHAQVARANLERAGFADQTEVRVGRALDSLAQLEAEGTEPFDFVFIDADKESYPEYLQGAVALARPGTVIVADNIVRKGAVFDESRSDAVLEGIRRFLDDAAAHPRLSSTGLQIVGSKGYDGIAILRVEA